MQAVEDSAPRPLYDPATRTFDPSAFELAMNVRQLRNSEELAKRAGVSASAIRKAWSGAPVSRATSAPILAAFRRIRPVQIPAA